MAPLPYRWISLPGKPYEVAEPMQSERGEWHCAARWIDTGLTFGGTWAASADEALAGVAGVLDFAEAARKIAATEPTDAGLQYVIPGCEKRPVSRPQANEPVLMIAPRLTGEEAAAIRRSLELSQAELATLLGMEGGWSERTIRRWEADQPPVAAGLALLWLRDNHKKLAKGGR